MRVLEDSAYLSALIGRIYDCALRPEGWQAVMAELAGTIGARGGVLGVTTVGGSEGSFVVKHGVEDFTPEISARMNPINPVLPMVLVWPVDRALVASRDFGMERLQATRFYREWLAPRGDRDTVGFALTREGSAIGHWNLITKDDRGPIRDDEAAGLELVAPHMRRAVEISNVLGMQRVAAETYRDALDQLDAAVLIVGDARRIAYANPRAESMLAGNDVLSLREGRVCGANPGAERALRAALGEGAEQGRRALPGAGSGPMRPGGLEAPVTGIDNAERLMFSVTLETLHDNPFAAPGRSTLLVLRAPREDTRNPIAIAARVFQLTPMQVQVLAFLAQGHAPDDIADLLGLSVKTVRTHLAELFRRTDSTRQADLVARVLSVASPLRGGH
ncbi:MAG TPA: helix-turn-helix transcriptional regulator [Burkholderiaceae bacterium]|nr:helix-turn-helix transcriptional regulator [Burkholderiaceae bacterium]